MQLIEYPDREMMMIDLANQLAGELGNVVRGERSRELCGSRRHHAGAGLRQPLGRADRLGSRARVSDRRALGARGSRPLEHTPRPETAVAEPCRRGHVPAAPRRHRDPGRGAGPTLPPASRPELPISVLLLGMGADLHIASLFPGADRLDEALSPSAPPLMALRGGGASEPRVTLTAPALQSALSIHVLITGPREAGSARARAKADPSRGAGPRRLVGRDGCTGRSRGNGLGRIEASREGGTGSVDIRAAGRG